MMALFFATNRKDSVYLIKFPFLNFFHVFWCEISFVCCLKLLWPRKGSLMKTQTRILDNKLYYTRKIELHRKGKKSRTLRITPILIYGICCLPHLTGKFGKRPFLGGFDAGPEPTRTRHSQKCLRPHQHSPY